MPPPRVGSAGIHLEAPHTRIHDSVSHTQLIVHAGDTQFMIDDIKDTARYVRTRRKRYDRISYSKYYSWDEQAETMTSKLCIGGSYKT